MAIGLLLAALTAPHVRRFPDIDMCLDHRGRWNDEPDAWEGARPES